MEHWAEASIKSAASPSSTTFHPKQTFHLRLRSCIMPASIERVTVEHYTSSTKNPAQAAAHTVLGISHATPRLSWRFDSGASRSCKNWKQTSYTVVVKGAQRDERSVTVESAESVLVPWPFEDEPLKPRERVTLSVSVVGTCDCDSGEQTVDAPALIVERALEQRNDAWEAKIVSSSDTSRKEDEPHRPYKLRRKFSVDPSVSSESSVPRSGRTLELLLIEMTFADSARQGCT